MLAGIPALPVIDARAWRKPSARWPGPANYHPDLAIHEVIANRVGSSGHGKLLAESMPEGIALLGAIPRHEAMQIPDRHLGTVQASELGGLDVQLDAAAKVLEEAGLGRLPKRVTLRAEAPTPAPAHLRGVRIAIAKDDAFAFLYRANLDVLEEMGAMLRFFSPLNDTALPECDALWLPGGYPELHAARFSANQPMHDAIRAHHWAGKPILAECGGLMSCVEQLVDGDGNAHAMLGLLPGTARMAGKLTALGLQSLHTQRGELRGHTYHHSLLDTSLKPLARTRKLAGSEAEPIYIEGALVASYFHGYFPSAPRLVADIFTGQALQPTA